MGGTGGEGGTTGGMGGGVGIGFTDGGESVKVGAEGVDKEGKVGCERGSESDGRAGAEGEDTEGKVGLEKGREDVGTDGVGKERVGRRLVLSVLL